MKGSEYIEKLIKQQEDRYQKKFAFERGQFHQCIPNPKNDNQMITVQKVARVLEGLGSQEAQHQFDNDQSEVFKHIETLSQKYQRYKLLPPSAFNDQDDEGEGEDDDDDDSNDQQDIA